MEIKKVCTEMHNYSKLIYQIIDASIVKERETMLAISTSYKRFLEVNRKYFGKQANDFYLTAYQELERLIEEQYISNLFSFKKLLGEQHAARITEKIMKPVETIDDIEFYLSGCLDLESIHLQMAQLSAKVNATEETKFKKTRFSGMLHFSYDDIISVFSEEAGSSEFLDFHAVDMEVKHVQEHKLTVEININKKTLIFKTKKSVVLEFENQDEFNGF